ncbi:hypothetical protein GAYE_SCF15G3596 [Galdieria yellowstonensis]|jgi:DNA-binding protein YbaB|uniref:Nucleoid-associated protein n=1 Tax=Galdieria yellowstonensis TaxID=3028027 RepID=A0AAV9IE22_9RHOD|nr:hypothetical protein GAYE_SCF15G3596 [Galdieria yellowstonensis]
MTNSNVAFVTLLSPNTPRNKLLLGKRQHSCKHPSHNSYTKYQDAAFKCFPLQAKEDGQKGGGKFNPFAALGNVGNFMDAVKKAQEFSKEAGKMQEELSKTELKASSEDGLAHAYITGNQRPIRVEVTEELVNKGADAVSKSVTEAIIAAHNLSMAHVKEKLGSITNSLGLPDTAAGKS